MTDNQLFIAVIASLWGLALLVVAGWFVYCARHREFPEPHEGATADSAPLLEPVDEPPVGRHHEDTVDIVPPDWQPHIGRRLLARETKTQRIEYPR